MSAEGVEPEEMPRKAFAEPISGLRLHEPVFPAVAVADCPGIELSGDVESPFGRKADFDSDVGVEQRVLDDVGLHSHLLGGS